MSVPSPADSSTPRPQDLPLPPGNFGLPLLGETLELLGGRLADFAERRRKKYGNVFRANLMGLKMVFLLGPEANQWIISGQGKFLKTQWHTGFARLFGPRTIMFLEGKEHLERRRLYGPHFTYASMRGIVPSIEALARQHFEQWADRPDGIVLWDSMRALAFQSILKFLFGEDRLDTEFLLREFQQWRVGMFTPVTINLPFTPFGKALASGKAIVKYLTGIVTERQKRAEQPDDLLGVLIRYRDEAGNPMSPQEIAEDLQHTMFAGQDTIVTSACNLVMSLLQHPEQLQRARREVAAVPVPLTLDGLRGVPYLSWMVNEGLRYISTAPGAYRVAAEDLVYQGYRIPKGWSVWLCIDHANRSEHWTAPEKFDPERFCPERGEQKKPGLFIPFNGGVRQCLGQHFSLVTLSIFHTVLLKHYEYELVPGQDLTYSYFPWPGPKSGGHLRIRRLPAAPAPS